MLSKDFTGDGSSATLPLAWSGVPAGTRSFCAHHAPCGARRRQVVLGALQHSGSGDQSAEKRAWGRNAGQQQFEPRGGLRAAALEGSGPKKYTYTLYALSAAPHITVPPAEVSRDVLLAAMQGSILATAELNVIYSRGEAPPSPADAER